MYRHGNLDKPKGRREELIEKGFSYCPKCNEAKELSEFNKDKHTAFGIAIYCRKCNKEKANNRYKNYKDEHRNTQLKSDYNITLNEYVELLNKQNGKCAICDTSENNGKNMYIDHDHTTGKIRGLLCHQCNFGLGHFKDNVELLKKAIKYLQK